MTAPHETRAGRATPPMACLLIPEMGLQWARRSLPVERRGTPLATHAGGSAPRLLEVCPRARAAGLRPGMPLAQARLLCPTLHAVPVTAEQLAARRAELLEALRELAARIEPARQRPDAFFLETDAAHLFGGARPWGVRLLGQLAARRWRGVLALGFERVRLLALCAQRRRGVHVLSSAEEERRLTEDIAVETVLPPGRLREQLRQLGIRHVDAWLAIPPEALRLRLGEAAEDLPRAARLERRLPLQDAPEAKPLRVRRLLEPPARSRERVLRAVDRALAALLGQAASARLAPRRLTLTLWGERGERWERCVEPAEARRSHAALLELLRLALEQDDRLPAEVGILQLEALGGPLDGVQLGLSPTGRAAPGAAGDDPLAAARVLQRLRSLWGEQTVVRAVARPGLLPEESFDWEPVNAPLPLPEPAEAAPSKRAPLALVRRLHPAPLETPRAMLRRCVRLAGPFRRQGGWWREQPVDCDHYYVLDEGGGVRWVRRDRRTARWFELGRVD